MSQYLEHTRPTAFSVVLGMVIRIANGARHRFPLRISDWFASVVLLSFGLVLFSWADAFDHYAFYALLGQIAPPATWGAICMLIGGLRIVALTVNGTFQTFRWSPHMRFVMALLSVFVWFQITLGLLVAHVHTTAWAAYPQLLFFDLYNVFLAASEAGEAERQHRGRG